MDELFVNSVPTSGTIILEMPVGAIMPYPGHEPPPGWFLCNGQEVNPATDPILHALLPNGKVPDLRSRFPVGAGKSGSLSDYPLFGTGGSERVTLSEAQMPKHRHYGFGESYGPGWWPFGEQGDKNKKGSNGGRDEDNYYYGTTEAGGGESHENRPPWFALNFIIKRDPQG